MDKLITELEVATEGSRELDRRVLLASGWLIDAYGYWWARNGNLGFHGEKEAHLLPQPTTSLDAALALVPEGWAGGGRIVAPYGPYNIELLGISNDAGLAHGRGATPALALCIAALKARQAMEELTP